MSENTQKLGKAIYEYFIQRTSPNEKFKLLIDSYTYEYCARLTGITDEQITNLLSGEGIFEISDSFSALAIVALEIKIAFDIETDSDLVNSYNNRLIEKIRCFGDNNSVQQFYRDWQDEIWLESKKVFEKSKRYLDIPSPKSGPGCYVQYPLSQRIIKGIEIIQYADRFIQLHLEPFSGITYSIFSGLVFNRNDFVDSENVEMKKRLIFSFYCMWDGRTYTDILNRKKSPTREQIEHKAKEEFLIQIEPKIRFYLNKKQIDLAKQKLDDKYLWRFDENKYFTRRGTCFIKDSDYHDWLPYSHAIDAEDEVLLLTSQTQYPSYIEDLRKTEEIEVMSAGLYRILILRLNNRYSFEKFRIQVKTQPYFSLLGGLKIKRNTYYSFALPSVVLTKQKYDRTEYKSVYLDAKEYPVIDGVAQLPEFLNSGAHCLKLLNSWDASEMIFYVESVPITQISEIHGWILNEERKEVNPSTNMEETIIDGLSIIGKLEWIDRNSTFLLNVGDSNLRPFIQQIERLENRFSNNRNLVINKRGCYGN